MLIRLAHELASTQQEKLAQWESNPIYPPPNGEVPIVENTLDVQRILCHTSAMTNEKLPRYRDKRLQQFVAGYRVRDFQSFERQLKKRLTILEEAQSKDDLRLLPSNHFEALLGDRKGQFSIRINQQWRLCFAWSASENRAVNIEVVDYH